MTDEAAIWFVIKGHEEEGPYTPDQLDKMQRQKLIVGSQELRRKGDTKRSTVDQALALKRQMHKNQIVQAQPISAMSAMMKSNTFRVGLLFVLLLCVAAGSLYYTGMYKQDPWAGWLQAIGVNVN